MNTSQGVNTAQSVRAAANRRRGLEVVGRTTSASELLRRGQIEEYRTVLRTMTTRRGQPFDEQTIRAYLDAAAMWNRWLTEFGFEGGFETATIVHYNGCLNDYLRAHTLGGTVCKQGNLRPFLRFICEELGGEDLGHHAKRNRYARKASRAPVLEELVINDLLDVTSGRTFTDRRDHAILRTLLNGPRRTEVAMLDVGNVDLDSAVRTMLLPGLKGHPGRRIGLGAKDTLALQRWLRVRARHARIGQYPNATDGDPLWIAEKTGKRLKPGSVYSMLRVRAEQAGYDKSVIWTHLLRHTAAHEFLDADGDDSDAMAHFGWRDRSMLDHYGSAKAESRAIKAVAQMGFGDRH